MSDSTYRGRRAATIENAEVRLTVLREGGHVAELVDKRTGVNPMWTPPWPTIEPSAYERARHPEYGTDAESRLLSGIMGHNLCLDLFGPPGPEEEAAGFGVHGEAGVVVYQIESTAEALVMRTELPLAGIGLERRIRLHGRNIRFLETIESRSNVDRAIAWTQHVTLGPPFLEPGATQFRASATRAKVFEQVAPESDLQPGAEFDWPRAPTKTGGRRDLRVSSPTLPTTGYTAQLMRGQDEHAFFTAFSPKHQLALGYVWRAEDYPWMGIWEESRNRTAAPWNRETITRGLEFGVSPFPESRRAMVERGRLFGQPGFRWLPARGRLQTEFWASIFAASQIPESLAWPGL